MARHPADRPLFALQTASPGLWSAVGVLLALALVAGLLGAVGSAVVRRLSNPVGKYRLLYAAVLVPFAILAYALLALLGFGTAVVESTLPDASGVLGVVLTDLTELLAGGTVWLVAYVPTVRGVRAVRDIELSTGRALGRMKRYVVGLSAIIALVLAPLRIGPEDASILVVAVEIAVLAVFFVVFSPWLLPFLQSTRRPTGDVAERIVTLLPEAGLEVRDVRVLDTDDEETASARVRGPPGYRRLFVTSTFLDDLDDVNEIARRLEEGEVEGRAVFTP